MEHHIVRNQPETFSCEKITERKLQYRYLLKAVAFIVTITSIPFILLCFMCSKIMKKVYLALLRKNFPQVKFVEADSIRTLLDTHRNQGIINVLLTIEGECDPELVKQSIENHIVEKKNKSGNLLYPVLRFRLLSCWGNYGWINTEDFNINNHIIMGSSKYRGRPLNSSNLQEYVSGITSKFLLSNQPPWQIIIIPNIPSSSNCAYGMLVRVHHLILEEGPLNIGDFLCLKPELEQFIDTNVLSEKEEYDSHSPLSDIVKSPKGITILYNRINDSISNHWNEFISEYDPLTSASIKRNTQGFFYCLALLLISIVSAYKSSKNYGVNDAHSDFIMNLVKAFHYERNKRNLSFSTFVISLGITFNPASIFVNLIKALVCIISVIYIKLPLHLYRECSALKSWLNHETCFYPNTLISVLHDYIPLVYNTIKDIFYIIYLIYSAPFLIIYEMFFSNKNLEEHHLQKTSSCGRKVVAWSEPIPRKLIRVIADNENMCETEILFTMVSACIKDFFIHTHLPIPNTVASVCKVISYDKLLSTYDQKCDAENSKGIILLTLPMHKLCLGKCHNDIHNICYEIKRAQENQAVIYILTSWQNYLTEILPSVYLRVFLNYMSRRFSVSILEVKESKHNIYGYTRKTLWGQTVTSIFYWSPPQSNTGISLTIQRYGDSVRLNVMSDSLLSPLHHIPARYWGKAARKLLGHHDTHTDTSQKIF